MRRSAVVILVLAGIASGLGCTMSLALPSSQDAGATGGASGIGGTSSGQGGRNQGTGGENNHVVCSDRARLQITRNTSDFLIAVGRNASMSTPFLGNSPNTTRMSAVQQALHMLVNQNQTAVNFGYQDFPRGCSGASNCCSGSYNDPPKFNNFSTIDRDLHQCDNGNWMYGCTSLSESLPIGDAMQSAIFDIFTPGDDRDRYLVLLIDGPAACMSGNSDPCVKAKMQIISLGKLPTPVWTYVIPIGQDAESDSCVQQLALAGWGVTTTANPPFAYLARDQMQLTSSLNQLVSKAAGASCLINLETPPPDPKTLSIYINNQFVPPLGVNGQDGWSFVPPGSQTIQLHGMWCDTARMFQSVAAISVCP